MSRRAETRRRLIAAAAMLGALIACAAALPVAAAEDRILPGLYRTTTIVAGMGAPRVREECFNDSAIAELVAVPPAGSGAERCTATRNIYAGGRIDVARRCTGAKGVTEGSVTGSYSAAGFSFRAQSRSPALPVLLDVRVTAQRLSATCGAGD